MTVRYVFRLSEMRLIRQLQVRSQLMYQLVVFINTLLLLLFNCFTTLLFVPGITRAAELQSGGVRQTAEAARAAYPIQLMPKSRMKAKPKAAAIYQIDDKALGDRHPFVLVHGLLGEYYPYFRWARVIKRLSADENFTRRFKIYMVRYDSLADLSITIPQMRAVISALYEAANRRPVSVMALSIGGNLVYESMFDVDTDAKVNLLLTLGTPFHGTPLFNADWLQYGIYKRMAMPWTRIDHALAYRLYFATKPNLLADFGWDDVDQAIPNIGRFSSLLPFGPKGDLTADASINRRLLASSSHSVDHKKLITYSGYLVNPYLKPDAERIFERAFMYPYSVLTMNIPAHLFREHPVLRLLNHSIATVVTTSEAANRAKTPFVYGLNDGITPLASALFLPQAFCASDAVSRETDVAKIKKAVDVRTARVFRNIDHLAFIDGSGPAIKIGGSGALRDELNPEAGLMDIFAWMVFDLNQSYEKLNPLPKEAYLNASFGR